MNLGAEDRIISIDSYLTPSNTNSEEIKDFAKMKIQYQSVGDFIIFLRTQISLVIEETISDYNYLKIKSLKIPEKNDKLRKIIIMH